MIDESQIIHQRVTNCLSENGPASWPPDDQYKSFPRPRLGHQWQINLKREIGKAGFSMALRKRYRAFRLLGVGWDNLEIILGALADLVKD